jgi:uncharacterized protein YlxW (UPF0749 family)
MSTTIKVISIITGIFVGIIVMVQFRTTTPVGSSYLIDQTQAQKELIKSYIDEEASLKSRIVSLRKKIDENLEQNQTVSQTANLETLNQLKKIIGLTSISGEGFLVELDDSAFIDREEIITEEGGIVYAADIRDIVNLLRSQNVKGIAINEQRVIVTSSITSVGNTLLINNSHIAPPFTISVIGDYESFERRRSEPETLDDLNKRIKENGIRFSVTPSPHVILPIYNGQFRLKYIEQSESTST